MQLCLDFEGIDLEPDAAEEFADFVVDGGRAQQQLQPARLLAVVLSQQQQQNVDVRRPLMDFVDYQHVHLVEHFFSKDRLHFQQPVSLVHQAVAFVLAVVCHLVPRNALPEHLSNPLVDLPARQSSRLRDDHLLVAHSYQIRGDDGGFATACAHFHHDHVTLLQLLAEGLQVGRDWQLLPIVDC